MTLENCSFTGVYGLHTMGTYDVVRGCHPAGEHHHKMLLWPPQKKLYKMGDHTRALKMKEKMCIKKCSYPVHIPPLVFEEIPKGM